MQYFGQTVETIESGVGFSHFDLCHILWLIGFVFAALVCCLVYRRLQPAGRRIMRFVTAGLILLDEIWKWVWLFALGLAIPKYLPLHLCSINIILIMIHAFKPGKTLDNFLYAICIPAALLALIFPSWTKLPPWNFMHLHSFTVHILLAVYPIMLTAGGDIRPDVREIPKCLLLLALMALLALGANLIWDTNFMFLMSASKGNPLYFFKTAFGSHLIGFPVLIPLALLVMYLPVWLLRKRKTAAQ